MSGSDAIGYRLDEEQRARVRCCLTKAHRSLPQDRFRRFISEIEASIDHFCDAPVEGKFREAHDGLRALWKRCHLDKPPAQVLRKELRELPGRAVEYIGRRARVVIPRLFPGETIEVDVFDPPERLAARFLAWANSADDQKFVAALRTLSAEGGRTVTGRSRGGGERSRPRFEPTIMGEVRGAGTRDHKGGAPTNDAGLQLVTHLALDWCRATGEEPSRGRSDRSGFGDLVHSVFQWLDLSEDSTKAAAYTLRRFWSLVGRRKDRAASLVEVPVCADCQWVQRSASRDDFLCRKLSLACTMARESGQRCGPKGVLFEKQAG